MTTRPPGPQGPQGPQGPPQGPRQHVNCKELCKALLNKEQKSESVLENIMAKRSTK